jgi:uroporphyrinogen III methyltransferase/synthase
MRLESYQWVIFTSVNGVKYFFERLETMKHDARDLHGIKVGAIGPKTAEAVSSRGIRPDLVPDEYRAEAIVSAMGETALQGARILLPRATQARDVLPVQLVQRGATVDEVPAYQTVQPDSDKGRVREMLEQGLIDMVTFTSSSTVSNFVAMFGSEKELLRAWMKKVAVACIGPITAKTALDQGLTVTLTPREYTIEALTEAIVQHFSNGGRPSEL